MNPLSDLSATEVVTRTNGSGTAATSLLLVSFALAVLALAGDKFAAVKSSLNFSLLVHF